MHLAMTVEKGGRTEMDFAVVQKPGPLLIRQADDAEAIFVRCDRLSCGEASSNRGMIGGVAPSSVRRLQIRIKAQHVADECCESAVRVSADAQTTTCGRAARPARHARAAAHMDCLRPSVQGNL